MLLQDSIHGFTEITGTIRSDGKTLDIWIINDAFTTKTESEDRFRNLNADEDE